MAGASAASAGSGEKKQPAGRGQQAAESKQAAPAVRESRDNGAGSGHPQLRLPAARCLLSIDYSSSMPARVFWYFSTICCWMFGGTGS
jgi:hypothetical protein